MAMSEVKKIHAVGKRMATDDLKFHEREFYDEHGKLVSRALQFSLPNGAPPPHDRQNYQLGDARCLADFEAVRKSGRPEGGRDVGPRAERAALNVIGQGLPSLLIESFSDDQVAQINTAWAEFARAQA